MRRATFELPAELREVLARARRLEWATLGLMASVVAAVYLTMGASQTMKAAWVEDLLSLVPPAAFLISNRVAGRPPSARYPYGHHRAVSIAFLTGAVALFLFGGFLLVDSVLGLVRAERPSIGTMVLLGWQVWAGWPMIAALAYGTAVPFLLGRSKLPLARRLHDKTLKADADMNRADWLTGAAGIAGILGVGLGFWWADAVAAGIISFSIVKDGFENLHRVVRDLMDRRPTTVEAEESDAPERVGAALLRLDWVEDARVRLREEGHLLMGEAFLVPADGRLDPHRIEEAARVATAVDWRIHEVVITAASHFDEGGDGAERGGVEGAG
jgi:cation diffusion facilitator family transporter